MTRCNLAEILSFCNQCFAFEGFFCWLFLLLSIHIVVQGDLSVFLRWFVINKMELAKRGTLFSFFPKVLLE